MQVEVVRKDIRFTPDATRVIARYTSFSQETNKRIITNVLAMGDENVATSVNHVLRGYAKRHRNISKVLEKHFDKLSYVLEDMNVDPLSIDNNRKLLIGAYFTMEYAIESAAIFNPSNMCALSSALAKSNFVLLTMVSFR